MPHDSHLTTLVMFALKSPNENAFDAGSRYAAWHLQILQKQFAVTVVQTQAQSRRVSGASKRIAGLEEANRREEIVLSPRTSVATFVISRVFKAIQGVSIDWRAQRAVLGSRLVADALARASLVEYQWFEASVLFSRFRRRRGLSHVLVLHDVVSPRLVRQFHSAPTRLQRWGAAARLLPTRYREKRLFPEFDLIVTLSEKDRDLVRTISPSARVIAVAPPLVNLVPINFTPNRNTTIPSLLFIGALSRIENDDAVRNFIAAIWPLIRKERPDARLDVVGSGASSSLVDLCNSTLGVKLSGDVPDLEPFWAQASVVVVPLRLGAGIKFKTVEGALRGVPMVTSAVGAEGIDLASLTLADPDNSSSFAEAVLRAASDPESWHVADRLRYEARLRYGAEQFAVALRSAYLQLIDHAHPRDYRVR